MHPILEKYIESLTLLNLSDEWHVSDSKFRYLALSDGFLKIFAPHNPLNKRFREIPSTYQKYADYILSVAQNLIQSYQLSCKLLLVLPIDNHIILMETKIIKIIDPLNDSILGLVYLYNHIPQNQYLTNELYLSRNLSFIPILEKPDNYNHPEIYNKFSEREQIIIWLLIANNGHKHIADVISIIEEAQIPHNTITTLINRSIFKKLDVNNYADLLVKLNQENAFCSIPQKLFEYLVKNNYANK